MRSEDIKWSERTCLSFVSTFSLLIVIHLSPRILILKLIYQLYPCQSGSVCGGQMKALHNRAVCRAMKAHNAEYVVPPKYAFFKNGEAFYRPFYTEVDGVPVEV